MQKYYVFIVRISRCNSYELNEYLGHPCYFIKQTDESSIMIMMVGNIVLWVWVNSGSWWWTGRPGVLQSMGSQRVGHGWATELKPRENILQAKGQGEGRSLSHGLRQERGAQRLEGSDMFRAESEASRSHSRSTSLQGHPSVCRPVLSAGDPGLGLALEGPLLCSLSRALSILWWGSPGLTLGNQGGLPGKGRTVNRTL